LLPHCGGCRVARLLRRLTVAIAVAAFLPLSGAAQTAASPTKPPVPATPSFAADYGKLPLSFEANKGQSDPRVKFLSRGNGYSLFLTDRAAVLSLTKGGPAAQGKPTPSTTGSPAKPPETDVVRMELVGANAGARVTGANQLPGTANYFIGNDTAKWHTSVPTYAKVKYETVYPGIALVYYGNQRQLEYDFAVAPGADPKQVRLHFSGAQRLRLNPAGDLEVMAKNGEIAFHKPVIYQLRNGQRHTVYGRFAIYAKNAVGFTIGSYDRDRELVIDPTLAYSTYLGGDGGEAGNAIAVDPSGYAYVTGTTSSDNFPTTSAAYQTKNPQTFTGSPFFVTKLSTDGKSLVYSTYIGGTEAQNVGDISSGIAVDASGDVYICGTTDSLDYPTTPGAFQRTNINAVDNQEGTPFITKLNSTGKSLLYSTFVGGSGNGNSADVALGIAVDSGGNPRRARIRVQTMPQPTEPATPSLQK
jgi:hypothetical protein